MVCISPCAAAKADADAFSAAAGARIESLTYQCQPTTGLLPGDDGPQKVPASASPCEASAIRLAPVLRRYNRYREALPYARAASDMNGQLGATEKDKDKPVEAKCLTRLPTDAVALNKELGLPAGTLQPEDLRQEDTGFRAALYRDESTGKMILVPRDTQPTSLVDWQTNTRNGQGMDTPQYAAARELASKLGDNNISFDLAGYSKGGGLAQEMALVNQESHAYVFNSAGLHNASLERTGESDFQSLTHRTSAFSAQDDFLTYMNTTTDPQQQIENAEFLQRELAGENRWWKNPMRIDHASPVAPDGSKDASFAIGLDGYKLELTGFVEGLERDFAAGKAIQSFPPVRAAQMETIPGSDSFIGNRLGASDPGPNLGKLNQHLMENVLLPMESSVTKDEAELKKFLEHCK